MFADIARPGRVAFVYYIQFFPKAQTLILKHLREATKTPIIIYHAVAQLSLKQQSTECRVVIRYFEPEVSLMLIKQPGSHTETIAQFYLGLNRLGAVAAESVSECGDSALVKSLVQVTFDYPYSLSGGC